MREMRRRRAVTGRIPKRRRPATVTVVVRDEGTTRTRSTSARVRAGRGRRGSKTRLCRRVAIQVDEALPARLNVPQLRARRPLETERAPDRGGPMSGRGRATLFARRNVRRAADTALSPTARSRSSSPCPTVDRGADDRERGVATAGRTRARPGMGLTVPQDRSRRCATVALDGVRIERVRGPMSPRLRRRALTALG